MGGRALGDDPSISIPAKLVVGNQIVVGIDHDAHTVFAAYVVDNGAMGRADSDTRSGIVMHETVEKQRLGNVFEGDAITAGIGDIAAGNGGSAIPDRVPPALENDAVSTGMR